MGAAINIAFLSVGLYFWYNWKFQLETDGGMYKKGQQEWMWHQEIKNGK